MPWLTEGDSRIPYRNNCCHRRVVAILEIIGLSGLPASSQWLIAGTAAGNFPVLLPQVSEEQDSSTPVAEFLDILAGCIVQYHRSFNYHGH
jgi:hypothetical protein